MSVPDLADRGSSRSASTLEVLASVVAVVAIGVLAYNWLSAHLAFLGETAVVEPGQVRTYWVTTVVLACTALGALVAALGRRARAAVVWHALVVLVGLGAVVLFAVTVPGPVDERPRPTEPASSPGPAAYCLSGGDSSECVGG